MKRGVKKLIAMALLLSMMVSLALIPAEATSTEYLYASQVSKMVNMSRETFDTLANGKMTSEWKNGKLWYKFAYGGRVIYAEPDCFARFGSYLSMQKACIGNDLTNGINSGSQSREYVLISRRSSGNYRIVTLARVSFSSGRSGSHHFVKCKLEDTVKFLYCPKFKNCVNDWVSYVFTGNAIATTLNRGKGKMDRGITPVITVSSSKGNVRAFQSTNQKTGKRQTYYCHNGDFTYYSMDARGYSAKSSYSMKDYVKVGIETAKTVSSIGVSIKAGSLKSLAQIGINTYAKIKQAGNSTTFRTDGQQLLSNGLNRVYKAKFSSPLQIINTGDYFNADFYTYKPASNYQVTITY